MSVHEIGMPNDLQEQARESLGLSEDWRYRDMPKTTKENYDLVFNVIGEGNFKIVTKGKYEHKTEGWLYRSQFFISPQGVKNLERYSAAH